MIRVVVPAQDRVELVNQSNQPWTLALVEGAKPGRGTLTLVDKFTGKIQAVLAKVGESATLPAQGLTTGVPRAACRSIPVCRYF